MSASLGYIQQIPPAYFKRLRHIFLYLPGSTFPPTQNTPTFQISLQLLSFELILQFILLYYTTIYTTLEIEF